MFLRSLKYWGSHIPLIGFVIMLVAVPVGFCEAWLWQNYVLHPGNFPLFKNLFSSAAASIEFIIAVLKLLLGVFAVGSILYALHLSPRGNLAKLIPSLRAGIRKWFRILALIVPIGILAWAPYTVQKIQAGNFIWFSVLWGIAVTLYFLVKYPLALPLLINENEGILASMRKGARLSRGIRAEILLVVFSIILLAEVICLVLSYLLLPRLTGAQGTLELAFISTATYIIRWFLYSPVLIVVYAYYREQLALYVRSYLLA
ncbi:hypothetical protein [Syntrophomonas curvata]